MTKNTHVNETAINNNNTFILNTSNTKYLGLDIANLPILEGSRYSINT
jgi:hypothetical protein